jgi:hypothetical protein
MTARSCASRTDRWDPRFTDPEHEAHALGRRERQVEPGYPNRARRLPQRPPVVRDPGEDRPQALPVNAAVEPESSAAATEPHAACLRTTDVVLLEPTFDALYNVDTALCLVEVVLGLAGRELADRKQRNHVLYLSGRQDPLRGTFSRAVGAYPLKRSELFVAALGRAEPDALTSAGCASQLLMPNCEAHTNARVLDPIIAGVCA